MNNSTTTTYTTLNQGVLPIFISDYLDVRDPVFTFDKLVGEMDLKQNIFNDINHKIFDEENVDLTHLYIDGSKFEANANKYTWVWKKATEKSHYRLYAKITTLIEEINKGLASSGVKIESRTEYVPDYLDQISERYKEI